MLAVLIYVLLDKATRRGRPRQGLPRGKLSAGYQFPPVRPYRLRRLAQSLQFTLALPRWTLSAPVDVASTKLAQMATFPRTFATTTAGGVRQDAASTSTPGPGRTAGASTATTARA